MTGKGTGSTNDTFNITVPRRVLEPVCPHAPAPSPSTHASVVTDPPADAPSGVVSASVALVVRVVGVVWVRRVAIVISGILGVAVAGQGLTSRVMIWSLVVWSVATNRWGGIRVVMGAVASESPTQKIRK